MDYINMAKKGLLDDIERSFSIFQANGDMKQVNSIWKSLFYGYQNKWYTKELYRYWLTKIINLSHNQGTYILCIRSIIFDMCEFNEKTLADFIVPQINFLIELNEMDEALTWLNYVLEVGAFFEKYWIKEKLDVFNVEPKEEYIALNNRNEAIYLEKILKHKD